MKYALCAILCLGLLSQFVSAAEDAGISSYRALITRNGKSETKLIYAMWSGEYPGPVLDVNARKKGSTLIQAQKSVRVLGQKVKCEIKNGVYHPWNRKANSAQNFLTVSDTSNYRILKNMALDDLNGSKVFAGQSLKDVFYLGENFCAAGLADKSGKILKQVDFGCDLLDDKESIKMEKNAFADQGASNEQWISLKCMDGSKAFVSAASLRKQKGVKDGTINGYGEVGPSETK